MLVLGTRASRPRSQVGSQFEQADVDVKRSFAVQALSGKGLGGGLRSTISRYAKSREAAFKTRFGDIVSINVKSGFDH